ncbi:MAG: MFS transporter [Pseudomonadota bacterium]|nr:MFS transporter [Pseudomonadota bacterium]
MANGPEAESLLIERPLPAIKKRHIVGATVGNALEFYDFLIYSLFAVQIGHSLFDAQTEYGSLMLSLATFGVGFFTRPLGALVFGHYADRIGRRPVMMLCFLLSGFSTLGMASIPAHAKIGIAAPILAVLARMVQGFSVGGEAGTNTAFLLEIAPPHRRGIFVSFGAASQVAALMVGGLVGATLTYFLSSQGLVDYGWRIAFLIGAAILPFGLWLRGSLPETLHAKETETVPDGQSRRHVWLAHRRIILLGLIIVSCGTIQSYIFTYIVTYSQTTLGMQARSGFVAQLTGNVFAIAAILLGGWLSDRIGRRPVNLAGQILFLCAIYPMFAWVAATRSETALVLGMTLMTFAGSLRQGSFYTTLSESFAKSIRGSGFGIVYSSAIALFGGTTQLVVTWLIHVTGSPLAPAWYLTIAAAIGLGAILFIPESAPGRGGRPANDTA